MFNIIFPVEENLIFLWTSPLALLLVVIHTFHEESIDNCRIRFISAREATKKEIKQYEGVEP